MRIPKKCHHKASGLAYVTDPATGNEIYLGDYSSPESEVAYRQWVAGYLARMDQQPALPRGGPALTVAELLLAYLEHADRYYRRNGRPTSQMKGIRVVARLLGQHHAETPAANVTPMDLRALRQIMVAIPWKRKVVNNRVSIVKGIWKWGVSHGLVPITTYQALCTLEDLVAGRGLAVESAEVLPAPREHILAALPFLRPMYAAMLRVHLLTGMRAGELRIMAGQAIAREGDLWRYQPLWHKTEHHGHSRRIWLGPPCQEVLQSWLTGAGEGWLWITKGRGKGKGYLGPVCETGYQLALKNACQKAGVSPFSPLQVRHTAATEIRAAYGLEAAQVALGHRNAKVTEIYAEKNDDLARKVAEMRK